MYDERRNKSLHISRSYDERDDKNDKGKAELLPDIGSICIPEPFPEK